MVFPFCEITPQGTDITNFVFSLCNFIRFVLYRICLNSIPNLYF